MPPQPLSNYRRYYTYTTGYDSVLRNAELAILLAHGIAIWAEAELSLARLLCEALDAAAGPFGAAFQALNSSAAQISLAEAAIGHSLSEEQAEIFDAIMALFRSAKRDRDKLAHGTWAWSEQIDDALLLIDPKVRLRSEAAIQPNWTYSEEGRTAHGSGDAIIKKSEVFAYKKGDLEEIIARFKRVNAHLTRFAGVFWKWEKRDHTLHQLAAEPDIQEVVARLRKHQQKKK